MHRLALLCSAAALASGVSLAQTTFVAPAVAATAEGNSSTSWPFDVGQMRIQYIYDSSHFTSAGVTFPVLISRIRMRANGNTNTTWVGDTIANLQLNLSTSPIDFLVITNTFASNQGADLTTVYNAPLVIPGGTSTTGSPGPFYVDIPFATPFLYDPNQGDLTIEYVSTGVPSTANTPAPDAVSTVGVALARRMQTTTSLTNATGTIWSGELANVLEFSYLPASGLFAGFTATPTSGPSPLTVNFTSGSFSSDPGGITSYAWDFDGDSVIDSTVQNPMFIYNNCGTYSVSLTVTDATHAPNTLTRANHIVTDPTLTPSFTFAAAGPNAIQLTDTSTPVPTSWAWDFDGDNVVDSTAQNPLLTYPATCGGPRAVTLSVNRLCRGPFATTRTIPIGTSFETLRDGTTTLGSGAGVYFDVDVTNPLGAHVCGMEMKTTAAASAAVTFEVYVTPGTYVGNHGTIGVWNLVATGATTGVAAAADLEGVRFAQPFYLPAGRHGLHVKVLGAGPTYSSGAQTFIGSDMTIVTGAAAVLGSTTLNTPRTWNGVLYYSTCATGGEASYGFFARGCAGTLPVSNLRHTSRPILGTTLGVDVTQLPMNAAIMAVGLSRTTSPFGPLPLDLTPFGAPGCSANVSPDVTFFLTGAANTATWSLAIPATPALQCIQFFTQAVVIDPTANGFGAVLSDAAAGILGNS